MAILLWFYFTLIFDGCLIPVHGLPNGKPMVVFSCLNPVDGARMSFNGRYLCCIPGFLW
jgi:Cu-processing system permease protein